MSIGTHGTIDAYVTQAWLDDTISELQLQSIEISPAETPSWIRVFGKARDINTLWQCPVYAGTKSNQPTTT